MSASKIVIFGAGGFGREVLSSIEDCNQREIKYEIVGFIDENKLLWGKMINNVRVLGGLEWFDKESLDEISCVVAIGDIEIRKKIVGYLKEKNINFENIIHPSVICGKFVVLGKGMIIQAGVIITVNVTFGDHVHININTTIGHDCKIGDFVTIGPGVNINGRNTIKNEVYIGSGTVTKEKIIIGNNSVIGAGTVVISNVPEKSMFVGVPGKVKQNYEI